MFKRSRFGSVMKRNSGYTARFVWKGTEVWRLAGMTRAAASANLAKAEGLLKNGMALAEVLHLVFKDSTGTGATFREVARSYLTHAALTLRPSTLKTEKVRMNAMLASGWTGKRLDEITVPDLTRWLDSRLVEGAAPSTINRDASLASSTFRFAVERGLLTENPMKKIRRMSEKGRARTLALEPAELDALLAAAPERFRPFALAAMDTGARRNELMRSTWANVDLAGRMLTIPAASAKTGGARSVPLTARLTATLAAMKGEARVLPMDGTAPRVFGLTADMIRDDFAKALAGAEIPAEKKAGACLYTLRHSYATLHAKRGTPLALLARFLGHNGLAMLSRHYVHLTASDGGREAAEAFEKAFALPAKPATGTAGG